MRKTTVHIDESLLAEAIKAIGAKTQREAIEAGLKYLVQRKNREAQRPYHTLHGCSDSELRPSSGG